MTEQLEAVVLASQDEDGAVVLKDCTVLGPRFVVITGFIRAIVTVRPGNTNIVIGGRLSRAKRPNTGDTR